MAKEAVKHPTGGPVWRPQQVYTMAVVCLLVGLALGYLFRGSQSLAPAKPQAADTQPAAMPGTAGGQMPSLEDMRAMADEKAAPLLEKLKGNPRNSDLLTQLGNIYKAAHQFKDAAGYYDKALQVDPKNVGIRTEMASCLYYNGDVEAAISQLQQGLHYDPKDANSLFNLGMIKWKGKQDSEGALAGVAEVESAIECGPQSHGTETDSRRPDEG
jgi:cytochrome c-type biogenesis protein CcmH/NrfG